MNELKFRLQKLGRFNDLDGIVLFNYNVHDPNFFYFTNSEINGTLFYDFETPKLFVSSMEFKQAKKSWIKDLIKIEKFEEIKKHVHGVIGINGNTLSFNGYKKISKLFKAVDISKRLEDARLTKTPYEIKQIRKACEITGKIYKKVSGEVSRSITESDFKRIIETEMTKFNVTPAFPTIVATRSNIAEAHHVPDKTKLGKTVLMDFGVKYNGYSSDFSRTVGSKYEEIISRVFDEVENVLKPGVKASEIDMLARKVLGKNEKLFITALGHGIGIETHEKPWISKNSDDIILPNSTFTIEPGLYIKDGIRIENVYLTTENRSKNLTPF